MPPTEDASEALAAQLGGDVPDGLRQLEAEQLGDLATAIADTRRRNAAALAAGGERALNMIPRLLRGPIRKIVG